MALKVFIEPSFDVDRTGGVARVVEAQRRYLPLFDIEIVDESDRMDLYIGHAGNWTPRRDIPRVQCCHGLYWMEPPYQWPKWASIRNAEIARALVEADMVVTPSEWVADIIRRDLWAPVNVVPNGIDPELIESSVVASPSSYVYWNKARIDAVCEIGSLTELAKRSPGREFVVTVPSVRPLPNVRSLGVVPYSEAIAAMRTASIYLATTREVFGVSVLEALACGVPLLGYAWGGQREQMSLSADGGTRHEGILVPPGNLDALTDALSRMTNPAVWRSMSDAAKERSRVYNWQDIMQSFAVDLHQLAASWDGGRRENAPEVTIVIPCYNLGEYLGEAIRSVYAQQHAPSWEIIVVDDASTDEGTREKLRQIDEGFYDSRTRLVRHPTNRYLAEALNTGIAAARGRWIINLDADNRLPADALRNLDRAADRHPELDVVYGTMQIINQRGEVDSRWGPGGVSSFPPRIFNHEALLRHENQVHSSAMFRRSMWERVGGYRQYVGVGEAFPKSPRLNSDAEFWTRSASLGFRFGRVVDQPTLQYRMLSGSMSRTVPEWDWTEPSPRHPVVSLGSPIGNGHVRTHEPIQITVIVTGEDPASVVESLWPQTFDLWEVFTVGGISPFMPPYAKVVKTEDEATIRAKGRWLLRVDSDTVSRLEPDALASFYKSHADDPRGLYDVADSSLEGKVVEMPCGSCGGGMRIVRRPGPPLDRSMIPDPPAAERMARRISPAAQMGVSGQMEFVEFTGSGFRTRYMHRMDPMTKTRFQYIFGDEPDHRRLPVFVEDVSEIVQNTQYRRVPYEELTDHEREQLDAINGAVEEPLTPTPIRDEVIVG